MTAEVVEFPKPEPGNGAREILLDALRELPDCNTAEELGDYLLGYLWAAGFKIIPVEDEDLRA
jgi:hypothetical protein